MKKRVPYLVHKATIQRKKKVEGKGISSSYAEVHVDVACLLAPQSNRYNLSKDFIYGQDYIAVFNADTDVRKGDRLVTSIGKTFFVNGTADHSHAPYLPHIEVAITTEGA